MNNILGMSNGLDWNVISVLVLIIFMAIFLVAFWFMLAGIKKFLTDEIKETLIVTGEDTSEKIQLLEKSVLNKLEAIQKKNHAFQNFQQEITQEIITNLEKIFTQISQASQKTENNINNVLTSLNSLNTVSSNTVSTNIPENLVKEIQNIADTLIKVNTQINSLRKENNNYAKIIVDKIKNINLTSSNVPQALTAQNNNINALLGNINSAISTADNNMRNDIAKVLEKLINIDSIVSLMDDKLIFANSSIQNLDNINSALENINSGISTANDKNTNIEKVLDTLNNEFSNLKIEIQKLSPSITTSLSASINDFDNKINNFITTVKTSTDNFETVTKNQIASLEKISTSIATIAGNCARAVNTAALSNEINNMHTNLVKIMTDTMKQIDDDYSKNMKAMFETMAKNLAAIKDYLAKN